MTQRRLLISFSGGETSAYMTHLILEDLYWHWDRIVIVFANTGEEDEATLEFVRDCQEHFGWEVRWVEGVQYPGQRRAPGYRLVNFDTASRNGEPFEDAIAKYGIPNSKFKDCTRNLKRKPIEAFVREHLKWDNGSYQLAIGIRVDEVDRISLEAMERGIVYPLIRPYPTTKPQINTFWRDMPFRLRLTGYQGNCKWCWKKSMRKHITLLREDPSRYDFPRRMERELSHVGPEFLKDPVTRRATRFRPAIVGHSSGAT